MLKTVETWPRAYRDTRRGAESSATLVVSSITVHHDAPSFRSIPAVSSIVGPAASPRSPLQPGKRLGPYRLLVRLGSGAQGEVWKAASVDGGSAVALKVLNPGLSKQPRRLAQFRREAERGARLAGPPLLRVLESGEIDGHPYMTMPLVEGVTLQDLIRGRRARLSGDDRGSDHPFEDLDELSYIAEMGRALVQAARALHSLHVDRVAHRDVKPANVLLDRGRPVGVYLCDLGLGRDLEIATAEQMRDGAGTPMFMAPERLMKAPADEERSDVYSMGATIFEAMTLAKLYDPPPNLAPQALGPYILGATPRAPREINPALSSALEAVIVRATARQPLDRFATADELADELERALPDLPTAAIPPPTHRLIRPPHVAISQYASVGVWIF